jgi:hypothetical protein
MKKYLLWINFSFLEYGFETFMEKSSFNYEECTKVRQFIQSLNQVLTKGIFLFTDNPYNLNLKIYTDNKKLYFELKRILNYENGKEYEYTFIYDIKDMLKLKEYETFCKQLFKNILNDYLMF